MEGASMRPGHFCPGKEEARKAGDAHEMASMRPGHFCPGKKPADPEKPPEQGCFNEAGAFLPRKGGRPADARRRIVLLQ